jgi:hypothetical protein
MQIIIDTSKYRIGSNYFMNNLIVDENRNITEHSTWMLSTSPGTRSIDYGS